MLRAGSIWTKGQKTLQDDNMRCRRRAQDSRRDLNIPAPPKTSTAVIDDEGGFFAVRSRRPVVWRCLHFVDATRI